MIKLVVDDNTNKVLRVHMVMQPKLFKVWWLPSVRE